MSVLVCNLSDISSVYAHEHDIHHLLAETFMCIFSLELLQKFTMNSMDKNVLLYSWWEEESATYKWEVFTLNGNKQSLSSFQINRRLYDGELILIFKALWSVCFTLCLEKKVQFLYLWLFWISSTETKSPTSLHPTISMYMNCWHGSFSSPLFTNMAMQLQHFINWFSYVKACLVLQPIGFEVPICPSKYTFQNLQNYQGPSYSRSTASAAFEYLWEDFLDWNAGSWASLSNSWIWY